MNISNTNPIVSVIIPAYNMRKYILDALDSVINQTYKNWEIIVVDDCSPEPHEDLIQKFKVINPSANIKLVRHDINCRLGGARNTGMKIAKGSIFAFLDSDDIWKPTHLEDSIKALTSGADITYCDFDVFLENDMEVCIPTSFKDLGTFPQSLFVHNFIPPSGVLIKRSAADTVGPFSILPEVHMVEDLDYWIRAASKKLHFFHIQKSNLLYRKHKDAATSDVSRILRAKAYVLFYNRSAPIGSSFKFKRKRVSIVCGEAARFSRKKDPALAVKYYFMSWYAWPLQIKSLLAAFYYFGISLSKKS